MRKYILKIIGDRRNGLHPENFTRLYVVERDHQGVTTTNDAKLARHFESGFDALEYWTSTTVVPTHWMIKAVTLEDDLTCSRAGAGKTLDIPASVRDRASPSQVAAK